MFDEGILRMKNAVVEQACDDYLCAINKIKFYSNVKESSEHIKTKWKKKEPCTPDGVEETRKEKLHQEMWRKQDAENFIKSKWFELFCTASARKVLERLDYLASLGATSLHRGLEIEKELMKNKKL